MIARKTLALAALLLLTPLLSGAASASAENSDPKNVVISTSDIDLFWSLVDRAHGNPTADDFKDYFTKGSAGVGGFILDRLWGPKHLADVFRKNKAYYLKARPNMAQTPTQVLRLRADLRRYKDFYPQAQFPNVYFVVGALNSAGTSVDGTGAIMGTEMFSKGPDVVQSDVPGVPLRVLATIETLAPIVTHELTHYNQVDAATRDLLGSAINEGSADFISQLADGKNVTAAQWRFGCAHEQALWQRFQRQMYAADQKVIANWLFSYVPGPLGAPPFIGYWLGSRIVQSYYERHADKKATVRAILHVKDYGAFLRDSGYPAGRPTCRPEQRWSGDA